MIGMAHHDETAEDLELIGRILAGHDVDEPAHDAHPGRHQVGILRDTGTGTATLAILDESGAEFTGVTQLHLEHGPAQPVRRTDREAS